MPPNPVRCAIYTRKSTEEGLDQEFNSLDAQREACAAYITSQRHEGWQSLAETYDDGGYSGGNIKRPGLQKLLNDIQAGKVDVIVVYKIDRLTRSLVDFAKMVELLDAHKASFVSVTQQFNTTTSMGRLTLNVLLSFAQFEREVTGERIRDKLAASKAKGMWMGGRVPLGYNLESRKLLVNTQEAVLVRRIYEHYLVLQSVVLLCKELNREGYRTKSWVCRNEKVIEGKLFWPGHIANILKNPLYIGKVTHKDKVYEGEHEAIINNELWENVQIARERSKRDDFNKVRAKERSLLAGILVDAEGHAMTPTHSNNQGKRYRYYSSKPMKRGRPTKSDTLTKIPGGEIEQAVSDGIGALLGDDGRLMEQFPALTAQQRGSALDLAQEWSKLSSVRRHAYLRDLLTKVRLCSDRLECSLSAQRLGKVLGMEVDGVAEVVCAIPIRLKHIAGGAKLIFTKSGPTPNPVLVRAIARAYWWNHKLVTGRVKSFSELARQTGVHERVIRRDIHLAWLTPRSIILALDGQELQAQTLDALRKKTVESCWTALKQKDY